MRVLIITNMYPNEKDPTGGIFVKEQIESIKKQTSKIDVVVINGKQNKLNYIKGMITVLLKSITKKYDVIHAHYGLSGIAACCQWRYPVIVTFHGSDVNLSWERFISKIVCRHIKKAIVVSERLKNKLISGCNYKYEIIPCGIDFEKIKPIPKQEAKNKLGLKMDKNYILFTGNPKDKIKRYDIYKKVIDILKNKDYNVESLILKDIPYKDMYLYYSAADVMILCSNAEGSPTTVKEALACNLPIVATDVGDVKELIKNIDGCFITKNDPQEMAEKVEIIIKKQLKIQGREKIKHLSLENIGRKIISVYEKTAKLHRFT